MFLSVVYLRECRRQPKQDCVFGETKSRSATKNWSGNGSGYGGGWKRTNEFEDQWILFSLMWCSWLGFDLDFAKCSFDPRHPTRDAGSWRRLLAESNISSRISTEGYKIPQK